MLDRPLVADVEIRVPGPEDATAFFTPIFRGFAEVATPEKIERARLVWEPERSLGVVDNGKWVAGAGAFTFRLTLPGFTEAPVAGVTDVGVSATHRRRGLLTALMARQLDDVAARGEPLAILTASESLIYRRFGYGPATLSASYEMESDRSAFTAPNADTGECRFVGKDDALDSLYPAFERFRRTCVGSVDRSEAKWRKILTATPEEHVEATEAFCVVHDGADGPDGAVLYRIAGAWGSDTHYLPRAVATVDDLFGTTPEVEAALWRFVFDVDLIDQVRARHRPVDDPVRWRLVEPRRLRTTSVTDWVWVRVIDVANALARRRYRVDGDLVLDVIDPFRPESGGRFRLSGGPDGADCTAAPEASPDLTLGAADLGAIYLGGVAPSALAAAGRVEEYTWGALARADLMFGTDPKPFCGTEF